MMARVLVQTLTQSSTPGQALSVLCLEKTKMSNTSTSTMPRFRYSASARSCLPAESRKPPSAVRIASTIQRIWTIDLGASSRRLSLQHLPRNGSCNCSNDGTDRPQPGYRTHSPTDNRNRNHRAHDLDISLRMRLANISAIVRIESSPIGLDHYVGHEPRVRIGIQVDRIALGASADLRSVPVVGDVRHTHTLPSAQRAGVR